ncbi:MAG: ADP-ribosylglycohydrolase family protein, partial [Planctomycetota bacterium]
MPSLFDKIHGCNAAAVVSNSMGDITEGRSYQDIEAQFGFVDTLLPQDKPGTRRERPWGPAWVRHPHHRPPGTGEDGIERHRLMCTAIIEQGGRVDIWDLARVWLRDIKRENFGYLLGNQDRVFYDLLAAGVAPTETGRYAVWPALIGTAKMMLPVGIVNAGDCDQAARDARVLGQLKDVAHRRFNFAIDVCAALAAACAEAMRPCATIDSILAEAKRHLPGEALADVEQAQQWTEEVETVWDLRPRFADPARGKPGNNAVEVLATGLAIFRMVGTDTRETILAAVNFGRDCDCIAYVAAGLAGAINGIESVPPEWVQTVEDQLPGDPYTVSRRSLLDTAKGLHQAAWN